MFFCLLQIGLGMQKIQCAGYVITIQLPPCKNYRFYFENYLVFALAAFFFPRLTVEKVRRESSQSSLLKTKHKNISNIKITFKK